MPTSGSRDIISFINQQVLVFVPSTPVRSFVFGNLLARNETFVFDHRCRRSNYCNDFEPSVWCRTRKNRRLRLKNYYIQRAHRPRRKGQRQRATVTQSQLALALARVSKRQRAMRQFQLMMNTAKTYAN